MLIGNIMKTAMIHTNQSLTGIFILAIFLTACFLFPAIVARADQDGAINLIGDKGICEVDGDFTKIFEPGDPIEVSRFNKPFGSGYVKSVNESYMLVIVETRQNDYFLTEGDIVHKPIPKEKIKMKMLSAQIKPKTEEEAIAEIVGTAEQQGAMVENKSDETDVVETDKDAPKSAADVQGILFERARTGGVVSSDTESEKQGKIVGFGSQSGETASPDSENATSQSNTKETKADSRRRKKAIEREQ
jgi:hypothetical protein